MSGRLPQRPSPQPWRDPYPSPALFRRQRLWMKLAAYRPLLILAGIWIVLLAIAVLAYDQLLYTTRDSQQAQPVPSSETLYPHERLTSAETATPAPPVPPASPVAPEAAPPDPPLDESATTDNGISWGEIAALVGTCALGSWVLSQRFKAPPRQRPTATPKASSRKRRPPMPPPGSHRMPTGGGSRRVPPPSMPAAPKRLAPYDPSQPLITAPAHPQRQADRPLPPTGHAPVPATADVTVVDDDVQHPLDWPEESLVNTADVRQRRSLSSYL